MRSREHVYRTSRILEEITIPYFHPIYLKILEEANTNPNFLVSRRRIPIHCPDLLPGSYKAGRETSMGPSSLVSVGQGWVLGVPGGMKARNVVSIHPVFRLRQVFGCLVGIDPDLEGIFMRWYRTRYIFVGFENLVTFSMYLGPLDNQCDVRLSFEGRVRTLDLHSWYSQCLRVTWNTKVTCKKDCHICWDEIYFTR